MKDFIRLLSQLEKPTYQTSFPGMVELQKSAAVDYGDDFVKMDLNS